MSNPPITPPKNYQPSQPQVHLANRQPAKPDELDRIDQKFAPWEMGARGLLLLLLVYLTIKLIPLPIRDFHDRSPVFLHNINLIFHEAGHIIFMFFGEFIMVLGGSLNQVLIPLICTLHFYFKEKNYLLCVCLLYTSPSPRDRTRSRMPSSA